MKCTLMLIAVTALLAAPAWGGDEPEWEVDAGWFADEAWEDGAAIVSVFRGKFRK